MCSAGCLLCGKYYRAEPVPHGLVMTALVAHLLLREIQDGAVGEEFHLVLKTSKFFYLSPSILSLSPLSFFPCLQNKLWAWNFKRERERLLLSLPRTKLLFLLEAEGRDMKCGMQSVWYGVDSFD